MSLGFGSGSDTTVVWVASTPAAIASLSRSRVPCQLRWVASER
ncbi:hypothetical protein NON20_20480 [Synechocystis sp. B12]|nr:hypothetical protein NON20_20480 [Synechocystis sp. B12]